MTHPKIVMKMAVNFRNYRGRYISLKACNYTYINTQRQLKLIGIISAYAQGVVQLLYGDILLNYQNHLVSLHIYIKKT